MKVITFAEEWLVHPNVVNLETKREKYLAEHKNVCACVSYENIPFCESRWVYVLEALNGRRYAGTENERFSTSQSDAQGRLFVPVFSQRYRWTYFWKALRDQRPVSVSLIEIEGDENGKGNRTGRRSSFILDDRWTKAPKKNR